LREIWSFRFAGDGSPVLQFRFYIVLSVAPERIWKWGHRSGAKVGGGAPIRRQALRK